jgi:DNA-binding MarR family transcriptional regulator
VNEKCRFIEGDSPSLLFALLRAAQHVENNVEGALGAAGLSLAKLGVLNHLVQSGEPLPLGQIAGRISCVKSNVTQLVDRLESDGLVARISDPSDRRCVRAAITDQGRERYKTGAEILKSQEQALLQELGTGKNEEVFACLQQLGASV